MGHGEQMPPQVVERVRRAFALPAEASGFECIKQGKWCNADIYRFEANGRARVAKEFHSRHPLVRLTIGRFLIAREAKALLRLAGLPGIPGGVRRLDPYALVMDYLPGQTLAELARRRSQLPKRFFEELEGRLETMHRAGFSHLDLRNLGNMICGNDGQPWFIDFQSCVCIRGLPPVLRRQMQETDYSGIGKGWIKLCEEPLDPARAARLDRFGKTRRFWIFKGYWLDKTLPHLRGKPSKHHLTPHGIREFHY